MTFPFQYPATWFFYIIVCSVLPNTVVKLQDTSKHVLLNIRGVSPRTGVTYKSPVCSNVRDHAVVTGHDINFENFSVLHRTDSYKLRLAESILIHKLRPNLNGMDSSIPLNILR